MISFIYRPTYMKGEDPLTPKIVKLACLSTDTKPVGSFDGVVIANGSKIKEIDTSDTYLYDASGEWYIMPDEEEGGGSGSGFSPDITNPQDGDTLVYDATAGKWVNGAGGGALVVHENVNNVLDKSWQTIYDTMNDGVPVIIIKQSEGDVYNKYVYAAFRADEEPYSLNVYDFGTSDVMRYDTNDPDEYPSLPSDPIG